MIDQLFGAVQGSDLGHGNDPIGFVTEGFSNWVFYHAQIHLGDKNGLYG